MYTASQKVISKNVMGQQGANGIYLPTANRLPKVNNTANLMGLTKTIIDCKINKRKLEYC